MSEPNSSADPGKASQRHEGWRRACVAMLRVSAQPPTGSVTDKAMRALRFVEEATDSSFRAEPPRREVTAISSAARQVARPFSFKPWSRPVLTVAATMLALLAGSLWRSFHIDAYPVCTQANGGATVERSGAARPLTAHFQLQPEDVIHCEAGSVSLTYAGEATALLVHPSAILEIERSRHGKQFHLRSGVLEAQVAKQPVGKPLSIRTTASELTVIGTRFSVTSAPESTTLDVRSGEVEMRRLSDSSTIRVASGHTAVAAEDQPLVSHPILPNDGLALWLMADAGIVRNGSAVAAWEDQSGNERNAGQRRAECQPILSEKAVNGLPAVKFDGIDDYLETRLHVEGLSGLTLFLVSANSENKTFINSGESSALYWDQTVPWGKVYLSPFQENVAFRFGTTEVNNHPVFKRPTSIGAKYSLTCTVKDGAKETLYIDGHGALQQTGKRTAIKGPGDALWLGRGSPTMPYFPGAIAEAVVYLRALPPAERLFVEKYLTAKYFSAPAPIFTP